MLVLLLDIQYDYLAGEDEAGEGLAAGVDHLQRESVGVGVEQHVSVCGGGRSVFEDYIYSPYIRWTGIVAAMPQLLNPQH